MHLRLISRIWPLVMAKAHPGHIAVAEQLVPLLDNGAADVLISVRHLKK